ncbi:MAG: HAMP domain-containing histidine kinase, partial [Myxococcales bacterium]|nr:HAMP domain-containing histidine kinase [Myxococcales bacterium]
MPCGFFLDWFFLGEVPAAFFLLRVAASFGSTLAYLFMRGPTAVRRVLFLGNLPVFFCAAAIEGMMLIGAGGHASPYYVGLCLCIVGSGTIFVWSFRQMTVSSAVIVLIWLLPVLLTPDGTPWGELFMVAFFLVVTAMITAFANEGRFRSALREFQARAEIASTSSDLKEALERLREVYRMKTQFFGNVSHELRTPLTLILGPVETLLREAPDESRESLVAIRRNAERLLKLIDELLDLSKLDAGGLRLSITHVNLASLAKAVLEAAKPAADARGISLTLSGAGATEDIFGDSHRLEIILTNLVGNALKYTPDGGRVQIRVHDSDDGGVLEVEDNGPGIPEQDLP